MKPIRYNVYIRKENGEEYRYIGLGSLVHDDGRCTDVYILVPSVSGFQQTVEGRTRFLICDEADFTGLFDESSSVGEPTEDAERRAEEEREG